MVCDFYGGGRTVVCRTPMREVHRAPDKERWCFKCRKHFPHDRVVLATAEPSYYEPTVRFDCPQCHEDHTVGFGMVREWG